MNTAITISEAISRIHHADPTLEYIDLWGKRFTDDKRYNDEKITEMIDCLLTYPNFITRIHLGSNLLTDKTGLKLARYLTSSSTIQSLNLMHNQLSEATYLAIAAALKINTSLQELYLLGNQAISIESMNRIDVAFVDALILNPNRPDDSEWGLYSHYRNDFNRLKSTAEEIGHPSMQASLAIRLV